MIGLFVGYLLCQLNILLPYVINNFLFVKYYICVSKTTMCRIYKFVTYVDFFTARSFSFHLPACSTSSWEGLFFVCIRVISQKFVSTLLRKLCGFFQWFFVNLSYFKEKDKHVTLITLTNQ